MKRTLLVAVAAMTLGLGTVSVMGQEAPPQQREGRRQMQGMMQGNIERQMQELNLTEDQKKQVQPILDNLREQIRTANQDAQQKIGEVLTEEQRTKLREMRERGGGFGGPGANMVDRMETSVAALDLTAEQKAKTQEIFAKFRPEFEAVREQAAGDRQAIMESTRPLLQDMRAQVMAVLTPEQSEKWQQQLGGGAGGGRDRGMAGQGRGERQHGEKTDKKPK